VQEKKLKFQRKRGGEAKKERRTGPDRCQEKKRQSEREGDAPLRLFFLKKKKANFSKGRKGNMARGTT